MNSELATFQLLENALRAAQLRQAVYANNIANMDTPGFKRSDVQFETLLQEALQSAPDALSTTDTAGSALPTGWNWSAALAVQPVVTTDTETSVDNNGNNVDVDAEMARLAENQVRYNALLQDVKSRFDRLRSAIEGGAV
jgi:flagellar basal-body rod protein FlgB